MAEKKVCMNGCEGEQVLFELNFFDEEFNGEVYCSDCLSNIIREDPACIKTITRVEE